MSPEQAQQQADIVLAAVEHVMQATEQSDVASLCLLGQAEQVLGTPFDKDSWDNEQNGRIIDQAIKMGSAHRN